MEKIVAAAIDYVEAETLRRKLSKKKSSCAEWDAIERVYQAELRLHALFCEGEKIPRINLMYVEYRNMVVDPPKAQA